MVILVTGSEGTIGKPLCKALSGHAVVRVDMKHADGVQRADVAEFRQLERVFKSQPPDMVVHLAAEFGRINGQEYYEQMWRSNVIGTRNVIDLCGKSIPMIFASSSEVYGSFADEHDSLKEVLVQEYAPSFHNEYALSKWANEKQIAIAGTKACIVRIFNAYGPGEHYTDYRSVVCRFLWKMIHRKKVWVNDSASRDMLYIDDLVRTLCNAINNFHAGAYNIAGDSPMRIADIAALCAKYTGYDIPFKMFDHDPSAVTKKVADISGARKVLGHDPQVSPDEGIRRTAEWMYSCVRGQETR